MKRQQEASNLETNLINIIIDEIAFRVADILETNSGKKSIINFNQINNMKEVDRMNQKEAAKFIGVCEVTMCKYKKAGLVPHHTFPGSHKITYYKSELREFMHKRPDLLGVARK